MAANIFESLENVIFYTVLLRDNLLINLNVVRSQIMMFPSSEDVANN